MNKFILSALVVGLVHSSGGWSGLREIEGADAYQLEQFKNYQSLIENEANAKFDKFEPIRYSQQVVAGMNYKIVYDIGEGRTIYVSVYQPLPYTNDPAVINTFEYQMIEETTDVKKDEEEKTTSLYSMLASTLLSQF